MSEGSGRRMRANLRSRPDAFPMAFPIYRGRSDPESPGLVWAPGNGAKIASTSRALAVSGIAPVRYPRGGRGLWRCGRYRLISSRGGTKAWTVRVKRSPRTLPPKGMKKAIWSRLPGSAIRSRIPGPFAGSPKIDQRATVTEQCASLATLAATEPSTSRLTPRLSPVPMTMWSYPFSSA